MVLSFLFLRSWTTVLPHFIFSKPWDFSKKNGLVVSLLPLFEILDETPCYVRQCRLRCIFNCLLILCLGDICGMYTKPIYALNLHSTKCLLWVPCSLHVRQNKRGMHLERINTTIYINFDIIHLPV